MGRPCVVLAIVLAGCLDSGLVPCGDLACPVGTACIAGACASPADVLACAGKADNEPCASETDGFCNGGACRGSVCGDLFVSPDEVCDDGNKTNGDGCSDDCRSTEICGNAVVDFSHGEECDDGTIGLSGDGCTSTCHVEYDTWNNITPQPIGDRYAHAMAYDAARGRLVTFGALSLLGLGSDTWEFDGLNWVERVVTLSPSARSGYGMCASPTGGVVMFGGTNQIGFTNDTWTWDGTQWIQRTAGGAPAPRQRVAMAFDSKRNRVVLFGGANAATDFGDTWVFDSTGWTQLSPATSPPPRSHSAMAYDSVRDRMVLVGGSSPTGPRNDVWEFDGSTWASKVTGPPVREGHAVVYETSRGKTVVFGGDDGMGSDLSDTWEWNGTSWASIGGTLPGIREDFAMAYDPAIQRIVLHGGIDQSFFGINTNYRDTLLYNTSWTPIITTASPGQRLEMTFAFDALRGRGVLVGGVQAAGDTIITIADTWEWDGVTWSLRAPAHQPPGPSPADLPNAIYDEAHRVITQFYPSSNQIWTWDGTDWTLQAAQATVPPSRNTTTLVYDSARSRVVMFGGQGVSANLGDTWEWDGAWSEHTPAVSPPARKLNGLAYDQHRHVVVLFGGSGLNDTWEYDGTTWTERTPAVSPPARANLTMVYEATRQRVMLFGGQHAAEYLGDTWEWDGTTWTERAPVLSPSKRFGSATLFDTRHGHVVLFGGRQFADLDETWSYGFGTTADPGERCDSAAQDTDHDGLAGCADPDCWGRCAPLCPPGTTCAPTAPHCGDGVCGPIEDYLICPGDCPAP